MIIILTIVVIGLIVAFTMGLHVFNKRVNLLEGLYEPARNTISFESGLNLTGMPIISVFQGKKMLNLILDTGSTCNVINEVLLESLDYTNTDQVMQHIGIEGNERTNKVVNIQFGYKNVSFNADFNVQDLSQALMYIKENTGVTIHGIVGSGFFKEYQYILDFKTLEAYMK